MTRLTLSLLSLAVLGLSVAAVAEPPPPLVPFGGVVLAPDGAPRSGPVAFTFALYAEVDDLVPQWIETQVAELGRGGSYHVLLGSETPGGVPAELIATGRARWIGVRVGGGEELPRQFLGSVGYALRAADADRLDGLTPEDFLLADGASGAAGRRPAEGPRDDRRPTPEPVSLSAEAAPHAAVGEAGATPAPAAAPTDGLRTKAAAAVPGALLSVSGAIGAEKLIYAAPRTHYLTLIPAAFTSQSSDVPYVKAAGDGEVYFTVATASGLVAHADLPNGAVVDQLRALVRDDVAAGDLTVTLFRYGVGGLNQSIAQVSSTGADPDLQDLTLALSHTVSTVNHGYYVNAFSDQWPGTSDLALLSVQLRYTLAEAP